MEYLQYIVEDKTIAELLGVQNFTNDESAILELVKNAYDANSITTTIEFADNSIIITDDGIGMNEDDIKTHWMHIGKSYKGYEIYDQNSHKRILAGSKGVGRFALAKLGETTDFYSKKEGNPGVLWHTDWNNSSISNSNEIVSHGSKIVVSGIREKWNKKKVNNLISFISKTYNDTAMKIEIIHPEIRHTIEPLLSNPILGINCLSKIILNYCSTKQTLSVEVISDEFQKEASDYYTENSLNNYSTNISIFDELKEKNDWDQNEKEIKQSLTDLGDFSAQLFFYIKSSRNDAEKFMYKHTELPDHFNSGVILYRNAFSISSFEGKKDWLEFGKRSRKSPAAATHPTGAWRVRENQMSGKVMIDKKENSLLQDLSNRQGLEENMYYELFILIMHLGISEFERYRQGIIRAINVKNKADSVEEKPIINKVVTNPSSISSLTKEESKQLAEEIKDYKKQNEKIIQEKRTTEEQYKYDIRILNVLSTTGLKAASIAHEMNNDRNSISVNIDNIIKALIKYGYWDDLNSVEKTCKAYMNIPNLLNTNKEVSKKIILFMDTMLSEIEKKQFIPSWLSIGDLLIKIKEIWERDYAFINLKVVLEDDICFNTSEDIIKVIFDNLILNSIQQNEKLSTLNISISASFRDEHLHFTYSDNGIGLADKYKSKPMKILEVHETTRKNGHGLGMWIVNNTITMSGGKIESIKSDNGFSINFTVGGEI